MLQRKGSEENGGLPDGPPFPAFEKTIRKRTHVGDLPTVSGFPVRYVVNYADLAKPIGQAQAHRPPLLRSSAPGCTCTWVTLAHRVLIIRKRRTARQGHGMILHLL
jgi:hypothetical protein